MNRLAYTCILALTFSCHQQVMDPIIPTDTASCNDACEHVRAAGCTIGEPDGEGNPCEIWCAETQGHGAPLRPSCWLTIPVDELTAPECHEIEERCFGHE